MDSRWPLILLFAAVWGAGVLLLLALGWFVAQSPLPGPVKTLLELLLIGLLVPGARATRRRVQNGKHPWAKSRPERG